MALVGGDIQTQTRRVMDNLGAILEAAGASFDQVVKTTIFLRDMADFAAMNEVYGSYFASPAPARATVQAARLPKDVGVEIELVAHLG
jgi:2-iminobutanoate/2-iminopropanoate deaminase